MERFKKLDKKKQERIINASLHVFSLSDFKHALTDDIASKAQISKGSLFQYCELPTTYTSLRGGGFLLL